MLCACQMESSSCPRVTHFISMILNLSLSAGYFDLIRVNLNLPTLPAGTSPPWSACASVNNNSSSQQLLCKSLDLLTNHNTNFNAAFRFFSLGDLHIRYGKSGNQETGPYESSHSAFQMKSDSPFVSPLGLFFFLETKDSKKAKTFKSFQCCPVPLLAEKEKHIRVKIPAQALGLTGQNSPCRAGGSK